MHLPDTIYEVSKAATCLYSKDQVEAALNAMAVDITAQLATENPLFICVVVGGIIPMAHLLVRLEFPLEVDYIHATRYQGGLEGREIHWKAEPCTPIKNRNVVIVDDILDGGITMASIIKFCEEQGAKNVYSAVLVDKEEARQPEGLAKADFTGLVVDNHYVFGFGMDYKGYLRNAPGIYAVAEQHM